MFYIISKMFRKDKKSHKDSWFYVATHVFKYLAVNKRPMAEEQGGHRRTEEGQNCGQQNPEESHYSGSNKNLIRVLLWLGKDKN